MSEINILSLIVWCTTVLIFLNLNKDPLSPDKIFACNIGVLFGAIFYEKYGYTELAIYVLINLSFIAGVVSIHSVEKKNGVTKTSEKKNFKVESLNVNYIIFWLLSIPSIISQVYLVNIFDGIAGYVAAVSRSEVEFAGLGPLIHTIKSLAILNVIHFGFLIVDRKKTPLKLFSYALHFVLTIIFGVLGGSRGGLLVPIFLLVYSYHNLCRRLPLSRYVLVALLLFSTAMVLGVARENVKYENGEFRTGLDNKSLNESFKIEVFYVGWNPIKLVMEKEEKPLYYGLTYLSAVTNLIPRSWWPNKPDTGGVIITKEYLDDAWGGLSYISTGVIPEAIINFGRPIGLSFGLCIIYMLGLLTTLYYNYLLNKIKKQKSPEIIFSVIMSGYIFYASFAFLAGDFANIITGLLMTLLILELFKRIILRKIIIKKFKF